MGCSGRRVNAGQAILKREGKIEKGRLTYFPQDSKTIVADHQQRNSTICAVATHPRTPNLIVR